MRSDTDTAPADTTVSRRTILKIAGGGGLIAASSTAPAAAQSGEYPEAFDSSLVHEQLWQPDRPTFADSPVHEQLWQPDRPEFSTDATHEQIWTPIRPEFTSGPVVTEIWGEQTGPGDVTGNGDPATDPDGDGVYEDVNGDGEKSITDVQALFADLDEAGQNSTAFDFNGDGAVSISDVQALFSEL